MNVINDITILENPSPNTTGIVWQFWVKSPVRFFKSLVKSFSKRIKKRNNAYATIIKSKFLKYSSIAKKGVIIRRE